MSTLTIKKDGDKIADDELAGPEGDESQGRETEGRRSDLLRDRVLWITRSPSRQVHDHPGTNSKGKVQRSSEARKQEFDIEGKREKKDK